MKTIIPSTKISISENNVLAVIGDQKLPVLQGGVVLGFEAHVISSQDYSPFGVTLSGRSWSAGYRYGINTQEKVDEIKGSGNHYTAKFWEYDPNLGRRWNLDPRPQISISDYAVFANNPIYFVDILGDKFDPASQKTIDKHKSKTEKLIGKYDKKIGKLEAKTNLSKRQQSNLDYYKEAKGELNSALSEIATMESSTQMYTLCISAEYGSGGFLSYDPKSDVIYVNYDGSTSTLAHELKHGYQFEMNQVSFSSGKPGEEWGGGLLYDSQDEIEAFRRDYAYSRSGANYPGKGGYVNGFSDITNDYLSKIGCNLTVFPGGISGSSNALDAYKAKSGGTELDPVYKTKTTLKLIREQNELNKRNGLGIWEKVK